MAKQIEIKDLPVRAPAGKLYEVVVRGQEPGIPPTFQKSIRPDELQGGIIYRLIDIVAGRR